jgi:TonB family protein
MFESVAPETFVPRSRKLFYESLPASIAAHVGAAALLIVAGTWKVSFPIDSPRQPVSYTIAAEPTPPPAPPAPAAAQSAPKAVAKEDKITAPQEIVAPTIIPEEIPDVAPIHAVEGSVGEGSPGEAVVQGWVSTGDGQGTDVKETGTGAGPGAPGGIEGGIGELPPNTVVVKRHQPLPISMTPMSMVYPFYPEQARVRGWEDAVAVRYVIGRDGRVRSVEVLEAPQREIFKTTVVKAISHWRFRPLMKNGIAQEVIHELVIYFKLT